MREFSSFFSSRKPTDKKRFRSVPFEIKKKPKPASYEEFKNAIEVGIHNAKKNTSPIEDLKDDANVVKNWITKNISSLKENEKNQLDTLNTSIRKAFKAYRVSEFTWENASNAAQKCRDAIKEYLESADQISDFVIARQGFEKFKNAYNAGDSKWQKFLIEREDGGLKAMFLGIKPCMLTEKKDFPNEYKKILEEHSGGDIGFIDPDQQSILVFSKSNVKRMLPRYPEYFRSDISDSEVSSYLKNLSSSSAPANDIQQGLLFGFERHSVEQFDKYKGAHMRVRLDYRKLSQKISQVERGMNTENIESNQQIKKNDITIMYEYFESNDPEFRENYQSYVSSLLATERANLSEDARKYIVTHRLILAGKGFGIQYGGDPNSDENKKFVKKVTDVFDQSGMRTFIEETEKKLRAADLLQPQQFPIRGSESPQRPDEMVDLDKHFEEQAEENTRFKDLNYTNRNVKRHEGSEDLAQSHQVGADGSSSSVKEFEKTHREGTNIHPDLLGEENQSKVIEVSMIDRCKEFLKDLDKNAINVWKQLDEVNKQIQEVPTVVSDRITAIELSHLGKEKSTNLKEWAFSYKKNLEEKQIIPWLFKNHQKIMDIYSKDKDNQELSAKERAFAENELEKWKDHKSILDSLAKPIQEYEDTLWETVNTHEQQRDQVRVLLGNLKESVDMIEHFRKEMIKLKQRELLNKAIESYCDQIGPQEYSLIKNSEIEQIDILEARPDDLQLVNNKIERAYEELKVVAWEQGKLHNLFFLDEQLHDYDSNLSYPHIEATDLEDCGKASTRMALAAHDQKFLEDEWKAKVLEKFDAIRQNDPTVVKLDDGTIENYKTRTNYYAEVLKQFDLDYQYCKRMENDDLRSSLYALSQNQDQKEKSIIAYVKRPNRPHTLDIQDQAHTMNLDQIRVSQTDGKEYIDIRDSGAGGGSTQKKFSVRLDHFLEIWHRYGDATVPSWTLEED